MTVLFLSTINSTAVRHYWLGGWETINLQRVQFDDTARLIDFELNNLLNWIFMKWFWIEYWIESILSEIQTLNWINLGIEQGYIHSAPSSPTSLSELLSRKSCLSFCEEIFFSKKGIYYQVSASTQFCPVSSW